MAKCDDTDAAERRFFAKRPRRSGGVGLPWVLAAVLALSWCIPPGGSFAATQPTPVADDTSGLLADYEPAQPGADTRGPARVAGLESRGLKAKPEPNRRAAGDDDGDIPRYSAPIAPGGDFDFPTPRSKAVAPASAAAFDARGPPTRAP